MTTFAYQSQLDKLPIPDLAQSCALYLEALRPLQSGREHERTQQAVARFLKTSGPDLQQKLLDYAASRSSYIEQFWYDSYLNFDDPVVLNLNPFFLLEDDSTPFHRDQVTRAAALTLSSLRFVRALRREELPPDKFKGKTLCMYQYTRLFGSARIPTQTGCVMQTFDSSKHIVVLCRSQFYWFDVLDDNADIILSEHDLALNFQTIVEDAQKTPITEAAKSAVGVLTAENRRVWARIRESMDSGVWSASRGSTASLNGLTLNESSKVRNLDCNNKECLKKIDWALFVVCLDLEAPESLSELSRNMLCGLSTLEKGVQIGSCTNRWYDKLQLIVTKNARAGINFEHTGVDGHTVLRFVSDIYTDQILSFARSINGNAPSLWATQSPDPTTRDPNSFGDVSITPRKLEWQTTPELSLALRFAETRLADLIQQNDFQALEFESYGMSTIKHMGFSPDAFVQMAFQAAYYSLYGKVESTYEPAMTKQFLHGRTESIRTVSQESVRFVRKFCEDAPAAVKIDYLRQACSKHAKTTARSAQAQGQDRHLYALFSIWKRAAEEAGDDSDTESDSASSTNGHKSLPPIFADPGWDKLNNTIISTSNCGNSVLRLFGFGPTSPEGFGLGYIIKDDSITICASSKHRQTTRFLDTLSSYFLETRNLWRQSNVERASARVSRTQEQGQVHFGRSLSPTAYATQARESEDEDQTTYLMSGYGYFDVGEIDLISRPPSPVRGRREIGRKLRLAEY